MNEKTAATATDQSEYEFVVARDVMVAMRDGVKLATDVYRPARNGMAEAGKFPVILERTPHGKAQVSRSEIDTGMTASRPRPEVAAWFVRHGYVVVYQDCRGRYKSEGEFVKYLSDGEDGFDTVAWLLEQPWCNGKIATMGLSYAAHTQGSLACLNPPGLAAMVIDSGAFSNAYLSGIRSGGALEMKQVTWAFNQAKESPLAKADASVRAALDAEDLIEWFKAMPWKPGHSPVRWVPEYENYLFEQWTHGAFDEYWKQLGIYAEGYYKKFADVPQIHMSSWYDAYVRTAIDNYTALRKKKRGPVRLIMGGRGRTVTAARRFRATSISARRRRSTTISRSTGARSVSLRWFDHWVKGVANGVDQEPAVRLFLMGGGKAGAAISKGGSTMAGTGSRATTGRCRKRSSRIFYLHAADGRLDRGKPAAKAVPRQYDYDPADPVPTMGGPLTSGAPVFNGGAFDQTEDPRFFGVRHPGLPLAARHDVLVFETAPLEEDLAVIGPIVVKLHVASNCVDTDFTAKLIDVHPPNSDYPRGFAMNLCDGILRCRYRKSWEKPTLMKPGKTYEITIEPFATCNLFKAGHRIRLDVSSSNFPRYDINSNTGEPEGRAQTRRVASNTVFVDRKRASHIVLPLVPLKSLKPL